MGEGVLEPRASAGEPTEHRPRKFESVRFGPPQGAGACVLSDIVKRRSFRANDHVKRRRMRNHASRRSCSFCALLQRFCFQWPFIHRPARTEYVLLAMLDRSAIGSVLKKVGL
jgi:hypothetical protein